MTVESSAVMRLRHEELLFFAACVCNCWGLCLCLCVCLEGRVCRRGGGAGMRLGSSWRWQVSRAMRLALRWCRLYRGGRGGGSKPWLSGWFLDLWSYSKLLLRSLYFNSLTNSDTLLDSAFEPVYWIVDNVTRWFGVVSSCFILKPFILSSQFQLLTLSLSSLSPLSGVCYSGHTANNLSCGHYLPVCPTHNPQHLPCALDCLAPQLWSLAPHHGGFPLLQGHHHLSGTPA